MSYRWRPSKSQARAFAERMTNDPEFAAAYEARKEAKADKRRANSAFSYDSAGGRFVPHKYQNQTACQMLYGSAKLTAEEDEAARRVTSGFACNERVHHDQIHIVNEWDRRRSGAALAG